VILAAHADQSLALLENPTETERRILGAFRFQPNRATLHTDASFMPEKRLAWSAWNYRIRVDERGQVRPMTVYWMNRLQGLPDTRDYFVSINGEDEIAEDKILQRIDYEHPLFNGEAVRAQAHLPELNRRDGGNRVHFCGAWFKYGFHEDGFSSAIECSRAVAGEEVWP
jgi:predicted NAD/FAD-binding protein